MIVNADSLEYLKTLDENSVDAVITDPPYGYSFMGKDWDKAVPSVDIWRECLRVLKPGGWCMVMSAPRSDVQNAMISRLMEAGFRLDFTPIYWTYASGFPKAGNIGKLVDKRLGVERKVTGSNPNFRPISGTIGYQGESNFRQTDGMESRRDNPATPQAKALDGSYAGFQPKPAVEVVIVAMKPLSEKTYVDQALKNGKGITWLDDGRIPTDGLVPGGGKSKRGNGYIYGEGEAPENAQPHDNGRFPANLLVSDDVLNDGVERKSGTDFKISSGGANRQVSESLAQGGGMNVAGKENTGIRAFGDSGSYSRYFDLDAWAATLPFLIVPKASKSEKNKGLEHLPKKQSAGGGIGNYAEDVNSASGKYGSEKAPASNHHPTVKPLKLMSYLITLTTREGDTVLDPFVGSGTTVVAAEQLGRKGIGIEREPEYAEIAKARLDAAEVIELKEDKQLELV